MPSGVYKHRENIPPSRKGIKLSDKTKEKMKLSHLGKKRKLFSEKTRKKMSIAKSGNNCHWWKGGVTPITKQIRFSDKYNDWRQQVFIRDKFTCQNKKCGKIGGKLHAHHKKPFHKFIEEIKINLPLLNLYDGAMAYTPLWEVSNGTTLCKKCHGKINRRQ